MKKTLIVLFLLVFAGYSLWFAHHNYQDAKAAARVSENILNAQNYAKEIQGPWDQFHEWTVEEVHDYLGGPLKVRVKNENGREETFFIDTYHGFLREWLDLMKGQKTKLVYAGHPKGDRSFPEDPVSYLAPDSPRVREEIKKSLETGGY